MGLPERQGLYDPRNEHDACGVGFVANIKGRKSHEIIRQGLQILVNLDHRGAVGADPLVGDGAGCLIQIPDALLRHWAGENGLTLPPPGRYAVAMCFLPRDDAARELSRSSSSSKVVKAEGQTLLGWRDVPTDLTGLGETRDRNHAGDPPGDRRRQPGAEGPGRVRAQDPDDPQADAEQRPRAGGQAAQLPGVDELYMPSFSTRTVVYKGLLLAPQVGQLLRRSARSADGIGAGAGAPALLHQHLPVLEAGASVPLPGA